MSKSGVFRHFGSKQELQLATVDAAAERFMTEVVHAHGRRSTACFGEPGIAVESRR